MKRVLAVAAVFVLEAVLFEAGMRLHAGTEAAPEFQALFTQDPRIGHVLKPGASARFSTVEFDTDIRINSAGVRDEEFGPKPPGEKRILILGDSLVMAVQVPLDQTFAKQLERSLNARSASGTHYRVINAGVQGYGPVEEQLFFEKNAARFQPDLVVVALYVANDAIEASDSAPKIHEDAASAAEAGDRAAQGMRRIVRRSVVLQVARLRAQMLATRLGTPTPERPLLTYLDEEPGVVRRGLDVTVECIERIKEDAERLGARAAVVLLPARFQVDDEDFGRIAEIVRGAGGTIVRDAATARFAAALQRASVPVFDPLPIFRAQPPQPRLYFERTAHLTARGHEVLAGVLQGFLEGRGLVP